MCVIECKPPSEAHCNGRPLHAGIVTCIRYIIAQAVLPWSDLKVCRHRIFSINHQLRISCAAAAVIASTASTSSVVCDVESRLQTA